MMCRLCIVSHLYIIFYLNEEGKTICVAKGGRGGRGNKAFANHENPAPKMSELGEPGQERKIKCDFDLPYNFFLINSPFGIHALS